MADRTSFGRCEARFVANVMAASAPLHEQVEAMLSAKKKERLASLRKALRDGRLFGGAHG